MFSLDILWDNWNNFLTVFASIVAVLTGFYQIQHYRAENPDIQIVETRKEDYREKDPNSRYIGPDVDEDLKTRYRLHIVFENSGRSQATVSSAEVEFDESNEVIELSFRDSNNYPTLGGNERSEIRFEGIGKHREEYSSTLDGVLRVDSTTGVMEQQITFSPLD